MELLESRMPCIVGLVLHLVLVRPYQATISPRIFECQFEYLNLARECCSGDSECCRDFGTNFSRHMFFCKRLDLLELLKKRQQNVSCSTIGNNYGLRVIDILLAKNLIKLFI